MGSEEQTFLPVAIRSELREIATPAAIKGFNAMNSSVIMLIIGTVTSCGPDSEPSQNDLKTASDVQQLINRLNSDAKRRQWSVNVETNVFEVVLKKLIKLGKRAERPLEFKLNEEAELRAKAEKRLKKLDRLDADYWKENYELDRLSNNCELLTALRRIQKKADPLSIEVTQPKGLRAIPGKLPTFAVKLRSVDVEKTPVWTQLIPHFHGSRREAQWRFEVKTADGNILPVRPNTSLFRIAGGIKSDGWLKYGDYLDTILPMGDFIDIPEPGEYTVTLLYHPKLPIADTADVAELDELLIFRSDSFPLTVDKGPKLIVEASQSIRAKVLSLVAELPDEGVVKIVGGVYDEDDFAFIPPESPAGRILNLNWQALPSLIDSLSDARLSRHRKAWVLSLLYGITAEHDLNPVFSGALPAFEGMGGKNTLGGDWNSDRRIIPREQDSLIAKWQRFRDQYLEIRESEVN